MRDGVVGRAEWFLGGLVFKSGGLAFESHRRVYHSPLGLTVIKKKKQMLDVRGAIWSFLAQCSRLGV